GDRAPGVDADDHTITFQGGNVGTVTDILIDGTGGEADDTLTVVIDGDNVPGDQGSPDVDADYRFTFVGTDGDDTMTKNNRGVNNDINFQGGAGSDTFEIWGGDLGASTEFDGGDDTDTIAQLGGSYTDDDFIMVSNTEELTVGGMNTVLAATLGVEADEAGLNRFIGGSGNDNVLFDAAFGATQSRIFIDASAGGDDTFNAGALAATTVVVNAGSSVNLDASDVIIGGAATNDEIIVDLNVDNGTADLSGVSGIENLTLHSTGFSSLTHNVDLGVTGPQNVTMVGSPISQINADGVAIGDMDGDSVTIDGSDLDGPLTFNGSSNSVNSSIFDSADTVLGSAFGDSLNGGSLNDRLEGNDGNDLLNGGTGNDTLNGGADNDTLNGDEGNDVLNGGTGSDIIDGGTGNDTIT
ncbi:hypothetical protein JQX02_25115, partial [Sulfitobacter pseudonitzschiae]|nr:hypothetical protein [Pseudosulfitobacter pseudonitzschiae]